MTKKWIVMILAMFAFCNAFGQDTSYYYITNLNLDYFKITYDDRVLQVPFEYFTKRWDLRVYDLTNRQELERPAVIENPDYRDDPKIPMSVRVKIRIPPENFHKGTLTIVVNVVDKNNLNNAFANSKPIFIEPPAPSHSYVNNHRYLALGGRTWQISDNFKIAAPEQVGLSIVMDYLKDMIDSSFVTGFKKIIPELEYYTVNTLNRYTLDDNQLKRFYQLLAFIEPYIDESSFWNVEAKKLHDRIIFFRDSSKSLSAVISSSRVTPALDDSVMGYFPHDGYQEMVTLYADYLKFYNRIRLYYEKLELILFLKTPAVPAAAGPQTADSVDRRPVVSFSLGLSTFATLSSDYNVAISATDTTVQLQKVSKLAPTLTAGVLYNPFIRKRKNTTGLVSDVTKGAERDTSSGFNLQIGIFLNYFLSSDSGASKFGVSMGLGYDIGNFSVLLSAGFRPLRTPRSYFVNEFLGQNKRLPNGATSVSISDNSIFYSKLVPVLGVSFLYTLVSSKRGTLFAYK